MPIKATEMLSRLCRVVWVARTGSVLAASLWLADFRTTQHHLCVPQRLVQRRAHLIQQEFQKQERMVSRQDGRTGPGELAEAMPVLCVCRALFTVHWEAGTVSLLAEVGRPAAWEHFIRQGSW